MNIALDDMYTLLCEQKSVQQELLDLSYEKRQLIVNNNTERLSELVQTEYKCLSTLKSIDKKRTLLMLELVKQLRIDDPDPTLSCLIENLTGDERERFVTLQKELSALVSTQLELNALNKSLLETHLEYTDMILNLLVGSDDPLNNYYGVDGRTSDREIRKNGSGMFDDIV